MTSTSIPIRRAAWALLVAGTLALPAQAQTQLSIELAVPGVSLGIVTGGYPALSRVPGVPVYYAPRQAGQEFPMLSLHLSGPWPPPSMTLVMEQVDSALDGWGCAHWFASPHPMLDGRAPADVIAQDFRAVVRAVCSLRHPGTAAAAGGSS